MIRTFLAFLSLLLLFSSCCNKVKVAEKFTDQQLFHYIGFENSKWTLAGSTDTIEVTSFFDDKGFYVEDKCSQVSLLTGFQFKYDSLEHFIHNYVVYNDATFQTEITSTYNSRSLTSTFSSFFAPDKSYSTSDSSQYYITDITLSDGTKFNNTMVFCFQFSDSNNYLQKLYVAPTEGPVKIELSHGQTFELLFSDSKIGDVKYFGFPPL